MIPTSDESSPIALDCYYRCPILLEEQDMPWPRIFVLAQAQAYLELSDHVIVKMHSLLGLDWFQDQNRFPRCRICRCEAMPDSPIETPAGPGRIISRARETGPVTKTTPYSYWVRLEDGRVMCLPETELRIEYTLMNYSPILQMRGYEFQHPSWFLSRLPVSRNVQLLRNASYGFSILAGCRTYLLPHQVSTIGRCLETRPVRYMLADEVGLGKTVEAISIVRILLSENGNLTVLIIVPGTLIGQWRNELRYKYGMSSSLAPDRGPVTLVPMESLDQHLSLLEEGWDILITDETHRLLKNRSWYEQVQRLSEQTEHILLLSATPIQERTEEYRRLLALLEPGKYGKAMTDAEFKKMVASQSRVQAIVRQQLTRLERYAEYCTDIREKLRKLTETLQDEALTRLTETIDLDAPDKGLEAVQKVLTYICTYYRLERNLIRNRRGLLSETMAKRTLHECPYEAPAPDTNGWEKTAIQRTLAFLTDALDEGSGTVQDLAIPVLHALFSGPSAFRRTLKNLGISDPDLMNTADLWTRQHNRDLGLANSALDEDPSLIRGRFLNVLDCIEQDYDPIGRKQKLVVFSSFQETAEEFFGLLRTRWKNSGYYAVTFLRGMKPEKLDDNVYRFQTDPACLAIVCDESGGEGRNFQNADLLVHLDLPWTANDLEQRIGRLDRLGRTPEKEVRSLVVYAKDSVEEDLFHVWKDALHLFEHSLSGLEIITGDLNNLIAEALEDNVATGLHEAMEDIVEEADGMRQDVEQEQDYDIGATLYQPMQQGIKGVLSVYEKDSSNLFAQAMLTWGKQVGLHPKGSWNRDTVEFASEDFHWRAARQALYSPPQWGSYADSFLLRAEGRIVGTFDRGVAAKQEDLLFFAPGDTLYDSIIRNAMGCSRGRCAAIRVPGPFSYRGFLFLFNVEPDLNGLLEQNMNLALLSRFRMYLPLEPLAVAVPLDPKAKPVSEKTLMRFLESLSPVSKQIIHLGERRKGKNSNQAEFERQFPKAKWYSLLKKTFDMARREAIRRNHELAELPLVKEELLRMLNGMQAEKRYFSQNENDQGGTDQGDLKAYFNTTYKALCAARPNLDAICYLEVTHS